MKSAKSVLFCGVLAGMCLSGFAQTYVNGHITTNTTWNLSGSPYVLNGSLVIDTNATLTLQISGTLTNAKVLGWLDGVVHQYALTGNLVVASNATLTLTHRPRPSFPPSR